MGIENTIAMVLENNDLVPVLLSQFPPPAGGALPAKQAVSQAGRVGGRRLGIGRLWEVTGQMGG